MPLPHDADASQPSRRFRFILVAIILLGSAVLIFAHLGHYALWDDESLTAMTARGVWRTGDTSVRVDDHNLLAYHNGLLIKGFFDRYSPPLQFYLLAPFLGLLGQSAFVCRLPFAMCGMISVALVLRWMWQARLSATVWCGSAILILTNASFFLFNRQCRYYALAMLFSLAVGYCYYQWNTRRGSIWLLVIALVGLLVSHYLNYAAVVGCLVIDYALWGRHRRALAISDWLKLAIPQMVVGAFVFSIWNPAARSAVVAAAGHANTLGAAEYASTAVPLSSFGWWQDYFTLLWWNLRDLLRSDFVIIPLLLACPALYLSRKNNWLLRAPLALLVFISVISLLTTHPITDAGAAEVRYLAPLLPLGIGIGILALWAVDQMNPRVKWAVVGLTCVTIFVAPPQPGERTITGATAIRFYHELYEPQQEPYTPVAAWINTHVTDGQSVYVQPGFMNYPLMFHAGKALYAWQLADPVKPEYAHVDDALIQGRVAPDYLIAFGPYRKSIEQTQAQLAARGVVYEQIDTVHVFWRDLFRPEKIWRSFVTIEPRAGEEVYVYRRVSGGSETAELPRN